MKKYLSLFLAAAMILTMVALPAAAAEEDDFDISLAAVVEGVMDITYPASFNETAISADNPVHPGDTFNVGIKVTPSNNNSVTLNAINIYMAYDADQFTPGTLPSGVEKCTPKDGSKTYLSYIATTETTIESEGTILCTIPFTVTDTATIGDSLVVGADTAYTDTAMGAIIANNYNEYVVAETSTTIYTAANTVAATVTGANGWTDGDELKEVTYYDTDGFTINISGTNITEAKIVTPDNLSGEDIEITDGKTGSYAVPSKDGECTLTVTAAGNVTESWTFSLVTEEISAVLKPEVTSKSATGYQAGETFEVPVTISGLANAKADMVNFKVTYPTEVFTLADVTDTTKNLNQSGDDGEITVLYGQDTTTTDSLANEAEVVTLKFTVNSPLNDAFKYGTQTISFFEAELALETSGIDPTTNNITITPDTVKVTVVPEQFGTVTGEAPKSYTKESYSYTVTPANGAEAKLYHTEDATTLDDSDQSAMKNAFADLNAADITDPTNNATLSKEGHYYVIYKIGDDPDDVYQAVELTNKIDTTAPTGLPTDVMTDWATAFTFDLSSVTDNKDDADTPVSITYQINEKGDWTAVSGTSLTLNADTTDVESITTITFKAVDEAGNEAVSNALDVQIDISGPNVTAEKANEVNANGKWTINITAEDAKSGLATTTPVMVYYSETALTETGVDAIKTLKNGVGATYGTGNAYSYEASQSGFYYVVATDGVGNAAAAEAVEITLPSLAAASAIKVKVDVDSETFLTGTDYNFLTTEAMGAKGIKDKEGNALDTNGWFTGVVIDMEPAPMGYKNYYQVTSTADEFTNIMVDTLYEADGTGITFDTVGDYTFTIITKHETVTTDVQEAAYKFSIVAKEDMPSINGDKRYNIIDYMVVKALVENNAAVPEATWDFYGGYFSGDVTGDLQMTEEDYTQILNSLKAGHTPGNYPFAIMNDTSVTP